MTRVLIFAAGLIVGATLAHVATNRFLRWFWQDLDHADLGYIDRNDG